MICPHCGAPGMVNQQFCGDCGKAMDRLPVAKGAGTASPPSVRPRKPGPGSRRWLIPVVALVLLVTAAGLWVLTRKGSLGPGSRKEPADGLQPSGPIVEVPPVVFFRAALNPASWASPGRAWYAEMNRQDQELGRHPDDPKLLNDEASLNAAGDIARCARLMAQAHQIVPNEPIIGYNYARALYRQGKFDEAIAAADGAITQKPDMDAARLLRAAAALGKKDYRGAEDQLSKLTDRSQGVALLMGGVVQLSQGKPKDAEASFQQAVAALPGSEVALYDAGVAYQQAGDPAKALEYYRQAIQKAPTLAEAHNNSGIIFARQGAREDAIASLSAASSLQHDSPQFQSNLSGVMSLIAFQGGIAGRWLITDAGYNGVTTGYLDIDPTYSSTWTCRSLVRSGPGRGEPAQTPSGCRSPRDGCPFGCGPDAQPMRSAQLVHQEQDPNVLTFKHSFNDGKGRVQVFGRGTAPSGWDEEVRIAVTGITMRVGVTRRDHGSDMRIEYGFPGVRIR